MEEKKKRQWIDLGRGEKGIPRLALHAVLRLSGPQLHPRLASFSAGHRQIKAR